MGLKVKKMLKVLLTKCSSFLFLIDSSKKYIYFTFDDGPLNGTLKCFEICRLLEIKATFFLVGLHAERRKGGMVALLKEAYPAVLTANHSYGHAYGKYSQFYQNVDEAESDFQKAQKFLDIGQKIARLPGRNAWAIDNKTKADKLSLPLCERLKSSGYNVIGWDLEYRFLKDRQGNLKVSPAQFELKMMESFLLRTCHTKNHLVLLMHDTAFQDDVNARFFEELIKGLKLNKNFIFETLENYPGVKNI